MVTWRLGAVPGATLVPGALEACPGRPGAPDGSGLEARAPHRPGCVPGCVRARGAGGTRRPCSDAELLLAACTNVFVIHGTIHRVAHNMELKESVITVVTTRVIRQTLPLLQEEASEGQGQGQASILNPLRCGVRPGTCSFLFMGWSRFVEAWLSCAPRFQEFSCI
ncbi:hypothetical protein NN561_001160 [Cricetulus griseus]